MCKVVNHIEQQPTNKQGAAHKIADWLISMTYNYDL